MCYDNPYAFSGEPLQLNHWWVEGTWDWESHSGRHIYTPMYRIAFAGGNIGPTSPSSRRAPCLTRPSTPRRELLPP